MKKKIKVFLVEDDPMIIRMYERKLNIEGFDLTLAFNGIEAMKALKKKKPDIILLDVMMPKMNGFETLKAIKDDPKFKDIPVVILTNLGDKEDDVKKMKEFGAEDYWVKANVTLGEIIEGIKKIIEKRSAK